MRKITPAVLVALLSLGGTAYAAQLSVGQALEAAGSGIMHARGLNARNFSLVYTEKVSDTFNALYVLNNSRGGYVVLAADDVCTPVLGYADEGTFDPDNIPPAMKGWLEDYRRQIAWAAENGAHVTGAPANPMLGDVEPITKTRWNQDAPYNDLCPKVGTQMTYTGCVATAIAQVLKVYQYPAKGQGSISYEWNNQTLSLDFSQITFDWANMLDNYPRNNPGAYTSEQAHAVAELMYACGIASYMNYGTGGSGANSANTAVGLVNNLGYDISIRYLHRDYYPLPQWCTMIHSELAQGHPVYYDGANSQVGHAFVLDGYRKSDGLFHVNWGWGGMSDGYFVITTLDPDNQGIGGSTAGYAMGQGAILGLKPAQQGSTVSPEFVGDGNLTATETHVARTGESYEVGFGVKDGGVYNLSLATMSVKFGVRLTAADGTTHDILWPFAAESLQPYNGYSGFSVDGADFPQSGEYVLTPIAQVGENVYDVHFPVSYISSYKVTCTPEYIDLEAIDNVGKLSLTSARVLSPFYRKSKCMIEATVTNSGNEYYGTVQAVLKKGTKTYEVGSAIVDLLDGDSETVILNGELPFLISAGEAEVYFTDENGRVIGEGITVNIESLPTGDPEARISKVSFPDAGYVETADNSYTVHFLDDTFSMSAELTGVSGYFTNSILAYFFAPDVTQSSTALTATPVYVGPDLTFPFSIKGDMTGMVERETPYRVIFTTRGTADGALKDGTSPAITCYFSSNTGVESIPGGEVAVYALPGALSVKAPAAVAKLEVFNLAGMTVLSAAFDGADTSVTVPAALAAGHYLVRVTDAHGATATRRLLKK